MTIGSCCTAHAGYALACHECGASCCAACLIHLESMTYCASCAQSLLETTTVRSSGPYTFF